MKLLFRIAFVLIFAMQMALYAQQPVNLEMMQQLKDEEQLRSQIPFIAHTLTDVTGPRLTNSPGYRRAVEWTVKTLKEWGLQNAGPEAWGEFGKGWSTEEFSIAMQ